MSVSKCIQISVVCDICFACTEVTDDDDNDNYRKARDRAKRIGWVTQRAMKSTEIKDLCPDCAPMKTHRGRPRRKN